MDFRKTFDQIPEEFDKYRPRYCDELFQKISSVCDLNSDKSVLEIGPGTGQATRPILETGCDYTAIELGENFTSFMKEKFSSYPNFKIINDDFETYPFEDNRYDLVFSAASIQWIPEEIAFPKVFDMLKPGGFLAMFMTRSDEKSANEELYQAMEQVYKEYFHVRRRYTCQLEYKNAKKYGFEDYGYYEWKKERVLTSEEYISYSSTHCEHITLEEPYRSAFYTGIKEAMMEYGDRIKILDTIPLYLMQKPLKYNFYGWETATVQPIHKEYEKIRSPRELYDILSGLWCADTCAPRMRHEWTEENKTKGQCSITAFLVQDIFGGKVYGIPLEDGAVHCYNVVDGCCFDLTSEQFGERAKELVYENNPEQLREVHFAKEEKRLRYEQLKAALERVCGL